jgi:hypothetical protein
MATNRNKNDFPLGSPPGSERSAEGGRDKGSEEGNSSGQRRVYGHDSRADIAMIQRIYKVELQTAVGMALAFGALLAHLYIYPAFFNVQIVPADEIPADEMMYFHHGYTAMLVIAAIESITVFIKIWCTYRDNVLHAHFAKKLEGNIGALFGEYFCVAAAYTIMSYNLMPVFLDPRTGRRVYCVRYMAWLVDGCGLMYMDSRILFNRSFREYRSLLFWTAANMLLGLWSAVASAWSLHYVFLIGAWITFAIQCFQLVTFLKKDEKKRKEEGQEEGSVLSDFELKRWILVFIILWSVLYGVLFVGVFHLGDYIPPWLEQMLWTGMDVVMKLSHTVVLLAWRGSQWEVDSMLKNRRAQAEKFVAMLAREKAMVEKDRDMLRATPAQKFRAASQVLSSSRCTESSGDETPLAAKGLPTPTGLASEELVADAEDSGAPAVQVLSQASSKKQVNEIYNTEMLHTAIMAIAFAASLAHLYIYPDIFGVKVLDPALVPEDEKRFFSPRLDVHARHILDRGVFCISQEVVDGKTSRIRTRRGTKV